MRILFLAVKYSYWGDTSTPSYEHMHMLPSLRKLGFEVHDVDVVAQPPKELNKWLLDNYKDYDLLINIVYMWQIYPETMEKISKNIPTIGWQCDDHWRFNPVSITYAPVHRYWVTTVQEQYPRYEKELGYKNAILSQWAVNIDVYKNYFLPNRLLDLVWIGQVYGDREEKLNLYNELYPISRYDFLPVDELIQRMNESKILLNLSRGFMPNTYTIKGRVFEAPATGAVLLTEPSPHIEEYYEPDKEIVIFNSPEEYREKAQWLLTYSEERSKIAEAGYKRTINDHTYLVRFKEIFDKIRVKIL